MTQIGEGSAAQAMPADSAARSTLLVNPRVNSTGHFPFSGSLLNHHLNADLNIFYEHGHVGFFLFKSYDFVDRHSFVNYLQPGLFATIYVSPACKVRGFIGYLFSQTTHFRDEDSDYYVATTLYVNPSSHLQLENTMLYYDYHIDRKLANRFLLTWRAEKYSVALYVWERIVFEEKKYATSCSLAVTWPTIRVSRTASLRLTVSYWKYLTSSRPGYALRNGFLFTLSVPVEILGPG